MFVPDFGSRYFISDFPYGLDIILSFARICNIQCNNLKMVSDWYHKLTKTPIVFNLGDFGINSINDIIELYI